MLFERDIVAVVVNIQYAVYRIQSQIIQGHLRFCFFMNDRNII